jgi:hypothetical protein
MEKQLIEQILLIFGAAIFGFLGSAHLIHTFFTNSFMASDKEVVTGMQKSTLVLTNETTMWKAWIGFNASHSLGAMLFSIVYILLAVFHMEIIIETKIFIWLAVSNAMAYLYLAKKYWFSKPFIGILIATLSLLTSAILIHLY